MSSPVASFWHAFLKLLVAQLRNQDPLNPMSNQDFIAQTAQFRSLEELSNIRQAVGRLGSGPGSGSDLATGAVLHVGDGKGGEALEEFGRRLRSSTAQIKVVAMDMSSGFAAWFKLNLPDAMIVFDHFHVIKLMNDRLDQVRRRTVKELEGEDAKALKKTLPAAEE